MTRTLWIGGVCIALAASALAHAQSTKDPVYRVKDEVVVHGTVTSVKTIPDWMGKDGVNIALQTPDALASHVDVATASFLKMLDFPLAVGDDLQLTGCWSQAADGSPVFLVHELMKQKVTLNVRDPRGMPLW